MMDRLKEQNEGMREKNNSTKFGHNSRVGVDCTTEIGKTGGKIHLKG